MADWAEEQVCQTHHLNRKSAPGTHRELQAALLEDNTATTAG